MRKNKIFGTGILLLILFVASACEKQKDKDYLPLLDGVVCEFKMTAGVGGKYKDFKLVDRIEGTEVIEGEEYYKQVGAISGQGNSESYTYYLIKSPLLYYI